MIEFSHPWFLVWSLLIAALVPASRRSLAALTPRQRTTCLIARAIVLGLLVLALCGVHLRWTVRDVSVIFLVDDSASISAPAREEARQFVARSLASARPHDEAGVVGFAAAPMTWQAVAASPKISASWPETAHRLGTDLDRALSFGRAIFPAGKTRRLVLLSDGNDTEGKALASSTQPGNSGIELWTVPLRNTDVPELLVVSIGLPPRVQRGEPFNATVRIQSNVDTSTRVKLYHNQFLVGEQELAVNKGGNTVVFANLKAEGGFETYEAEAIPAADTLLENNRAQGTVSVGGEPRVLLADSDPSKIEALAGALRLAKMAVETRPATGVPRTLEDLQQFDLFILSDVAALGLSREQMEMYRAWVLDFGGGFIMAGGENSFGVGGYYQTPIEQMLPVRMDHDDRIETPSVALLVVLDRSGSMTAQVQGQTKMSLANQGAVLALDVLESKDLFGVLAVDTRTHTIAALGRQENKAAAAQNILRITAGGGGIYVYTSLAESFQLLRQVDAKIKHVILFSDSADAEEKFAGEMGDGTRGGGSALDLAAAMLSDRITTSVVALGLESDKDTPFLRQLAERGNGRFYLTSDAFSLPKIFSTETMKVAQSSLVEEPFVPVQTGASTMLDGIAWSDAPLLLGYNTTKPKPTAEVVLATERGEPLLAFWRYGLGRAAAFTSDAKSRWASEWLGWPGFGKFWAQLARHVMRKADASNFQVTAEEMGNRLTLKIDAITPEGAFRNELPITINGVAPNGAKRSVTAEQIGPGSYSAVFELPDEPGTSLFSIGSPELRDGEHVFGHTRSYSSEFLALGTNEELLRELAARGGGRYAPTPEQIFQPPEQPSFERRDLTSLFLSAALLIFPLDIWLRRRTWRDTD